MTLREVLNLITALAGGGLIGLFFFGGLWWTVQKGVLSKHPALLFFGSLLVRMSIALAGFYFIGRDHWERILACLLGFVIARFFINRWRTGHAS
jgi:F1F0 ATPase subunit 2